MEKYRTVGWDGLDYLCSCSSYWTADHYSSSGLSRSRFIFPVASLPGEKAVKWLFVANPGPHSEALPKLPGASLIIRRALPGGAGWRLWYDWQIPRLAKRHRAGLVMLTAGIAAAASPAPTMPLDFWMPERANPAEGGTGKHYPSIYRGRLVESLDRAGAVFCFSDSDQAWLTGLHPAEKRSLSFPRLPRSAQRDPLPLPKEKDKRKEEMLRERNTFG